MKTATTVILQLGLLVAISITSGDAFFLSDVDATKDMLDCHSSHRVNNGTHYACYDNVKVESCLRKIGSVNTWKTLKIKTLISDNANERAVCPGFVGTNTCRESESKRCKEVFNAKLLFDDTSICDEVQKVRDCMWSKLNDSCSDDVIREELLEIEDTERDCKGGKFEGPCSKDTIVSCADPVYIDQYSAEHNFDCNMTLVANAKQCLSTLETNCKTEDQRKEIKIERNLLSYAC